MLTLKTIASSSAGNFHILRRNDEVLILDCGIPMAKIKQALNWQIGGIKAVLVTHVHQDHSKSIQNFRNMGIEAFAPYEQSVKKPQCKQFGGFKVTSLPMLDKSMEVWQHTNTDLSQCPIYGFLIEADGQKLLYVTDTKQCVWNFKAQKLNHILLGTNYQLELLEDNAKRNHSLTGHMSLSTAVAMIEANSTDALRNVILCHLSAQNSDSDKMLAEVQKAAGCGVKCICAEPGLEIELSEYPF